MPSNLDSPFVTPLGISQQDSNSPAVITARLWSNVVQSSSHRATTPWLISACEQHKATHVHAHCHAEADAPAARVMDSFMMEPPMSLQPHASRAAARSGPIFTHDAWFGGKISFVTGQTSDVCMPSRYTCGLKGSPSLLNIGQEHQRTMREAKRGVLFRHLDVG